MSTQDMTQDSEQNMEAWDNILGIMEANKQQGQMTKVQHDQGGQYPI